MNIGPLKKSIIRESIISLVTFFVFAAGAFFATTVYDNFLQQKNTLEQGANQLLTQKKALQTKYSNFQKNILIYKEMEQRTASPGLYIDRQAVKDLFNIYRSQFYLTKLSVDMQPVSESTNPKYVRKNFITMTSDVSVDFEASVDTDIYALMDVLKKELPGTIKITSLTLKKKEELNDNAIKLIRTQGAYGLIEGNLKFTWFGIKSLDPNSTENKFVIKKQKKRRNIDPHQLSPNQVPPSGDLPPPTHEAL